MATINGTHVNFVKVPSMAKFEDLTSKVDGTIYFIVDAKKIYLDGVMYGFNDADVANKFVKLTGDTMTGNLTISDGDENIIIKPERIEFNLNDGKGRMISPVVGGLNIDAGITNFTFLEDRFLLRHGQNNDPVIIKGVADPEDDTDAINKGYLNTHVINKIGANNGIATLDESGLVPSTQLPSYVDDVVEYSAKASFPATGETGKLYVDLSNNKVWRWSGSAYVNVSDGNAHLTLGTTASTAFQGNLGKAAHDHSKLTSGNPHGVTAADLELDSVENYAVAGKVEAESGESNYHYMTPLRTKQAVEKLAPKLAWTVVA